jgi:hypothetical protein
MSLIPRRLVKTDPDRPLWQHPVYLAAIEQLKNGPAPAEIEGLPLRYPWEPTPADVLFLRDLNISWE